MQLCKKLYSSRKLHPNLSIPIRPHTKTKLHTKPRSISNSPRKMMKKMPDEKFFFSIKFIFQKKISHIFGGGVFPPPPPGCTLRRRSAGPRRRRASASLAARALLFELCIAAGPSVQIVRLTSKIRQKLGFKKFSIFVSPETCSGSWAFIKYQV